MGDGSASVEVDRRPIDPGREGVGHPLLLNGDPADPIREAVHVKRSVSEVGKHAVGDLPVVIDKVALGDTVIREENLVRVGDGDRVPVDAQHDGDVQDCAAVTVAFPWNQARVSAIACSRRVGRLPNALANLLWSTTHGRSDW